MKTNKILNGLLVLTVLSFIGTIIVYWYLPDQIPIHWGVNGEPDNYGHKSMSLLLGALPLVIYLLMIVIPRIDPKKESFELHKKSYRITRIILIIFLMIVHWVSILIALGYELNIALIIKLLVGVVFIIIGNYMPQIRNNYFFGIRTPWTLANETVWRKTHRLGGYGFIISGVLFLITAPFDNIVAVIIPLGFMLLMVVGVFLYSYLEFKRIDVDK